MKYLLVAITTAFCMMTMGQSKKSVFLFAYFKDNGQDGVYYAASNDGWHWKSLNIDRPIIAPAVGKDKLMRDPCIIRGADGLFHMVWTTGWTDRYIGYASSKDLIHWPKQQTIPVMEHEPTARNSWAPDLTYDNVGRQYMIYWSTTIPGRFQNQGSEDNYNHRVYYTLTKDFRSFTKARVLIDPGFNCIDATIIPDEKGYRVFLKDETLVPARKNLRTGTSVRIEGPYTISEKPISGNYWAEGPTTIHRDGKWIVYFDKYQLENYGAVESADTKIWTDISDRISLPQGLRHGTILEISEAELQQVENGFR